MGGLEPRLEIKSATEGPSLHVDACTWVPVNKCSEDKETHLFESMVR